MSATRTATVSPSGRTTLPVELRRRWGMSDGGRVGIIDLGGAALVVPGGTEAANAEIWRTIRGRYESDLATITDHDLADP